MKTAIVILNWNGRKMLETYLPSVTASLTDDVALVVADNGSTDDSLAFLAENYPSVLTIRLAKNLGFAGGYNEALKHLDAEYFVLLNSDVEVTPHWLKPLVDYMDAHDDVAACQPKLLSHTDKSRFEYAGAAGGFLDRYGYPFCRGRLFDTLESDRGQYDSPVEILWATGACLMIRSTDFWRAGGFDSRFFAHNEEIDLCWRLKIMGRRIVCLPQSVVYHLGGGTLPKGNPMKTFLNFRNNLTMLYKCLPEEDLHRVMCRRWFLDYLAAWQTLLLNRNVGDFKAIYKARRAFRKWLPEFREDRECIQRSRCLPALEERKNFSLLWQYYAKRKKFYSELNAQ